MSHAPNRHAISFTQAIMLMHLSETDRSWCVYCLQRVRDALVSERQVLLEGLQEILFLEPYPSHANFILCKVSGFTTDISPTSQIVTQLVSWEFC